MKKYIVLLISLLSLSSISCFRSANKEHRAEKYLIKKLTLNQAQQTALTTAIKEYNLLFVDSKKTLQETKELIKLEAQKEQFNSDAVANALQERLDDFSAMIPEYMAIFGEFHAQLTPQQRQELGELIGKKLYKKHHRRYKNQDSYDKQNKKGY